MQLARVVVEWAGTSVVGRAVNVLHFAGDGSAPSSSAIKSAYTAVAGNIPNTCTITVPNTGDIIEDTTGDLVGVWTSTGGGNVIGSAPSAAAAGVGACVGWQTGGIVSGRKLRGRTFLVPFSTACYDADGTLTTTALGSTTAFADALMASGPLAVWHRPTTVGGSDGTSYGVVARKVRDKVAYLSSRRD